VRHVTTVAPDHTQELAVEVVRSVPRLSDDELAEISASFETAPATTVIRWAAQQFGDRLCLTTSMTDAVLIDLAHKVDPGVEVVFVDTGYHFPETMETLHRVVGHYDLNIHVARPDGFHELDDLWMDDPDGCCAVRKVAPMERALATKAAWMSGLRRAESETRRHSPIVGRDRRGLVKVNPLATWTDDDIEGYIADNGIIVNPLVAQGFTSIGCWPCTRAVQPGEDKRAGRWTGFAKTECGLHD
jgi:phosphoadenosine phosphosulfate reductase